MEPVRTKAVSFQPFQPKKAARWAALFVLAEREGLFAACGGSPLRGRRRKATTFSPRHLKRYAFHLPDPSRTQGLSPGSPSLVITKRPLVGRFVMTGGEGGIRTPGRFNPSTVFKTAAFDHSATSPRLVRLRGRYSSRFGLIDPTLNKPVRRPRRKTQLANGSRHRPPSPPRMDGHRLADTRFAAIGNYCRFAT